MNRQGLSLKILNFSKMSNWSSLKLCLASQRPKTFDRERKEKIRRKRVKRLCQGFGLKVSLQRYKFFVISSSDEKVNRFGGLGIAFFGSHQSWWKIHVYNILSTEKIHSLEEFCEKLFCFSAFKENLLHNFWAKA